MALGLALVTGAHTAVCAQSGTQPITFKWGDGHIGPIVPVYFAEGPLVCSSPVHASALRGITVTDSAAIKQLVARREDEIWTKASKAVYPIAYKLANYDSDPEVRKSMAPEGKKAAEAEWEANSKLHVELYDKLLPELRPLVPSAQQATFDENVKALKEGHYIVHQQRQKWWSLVQCSHIWLQSHVHGVALRGITFSDSAAMNQLVYAQAKEVWDKASKLLRLGIGEKSPQAQAKAALEANRKLHVELFNKLLPQLRPLIPADQQATLDQNVKVLQASDFSIVITDVPPAPGGSRPRSAPVDIMVGCGPSSIECFP